eukprot:scaffold5868_cov120-Isochrysis_galbana.AAC.4
MGTPHGPLYWRPLGRSCSTRVCWRRRALDRFSLTAWGSAKLDIGNLCCLLRRTPWRKKHSRHRRRRLRKWPHSPKRRVRCFSRYRILRSGQEREETI